MFKAASNAIRSTFSYLTNGYDAINPSTKRRSSGSRIKTSDHLMSDQNRREMAESANDLVRNYSVTAWAIRKHLDYVSTFNFQPMTGSPELDESLSKLVRWWSLPKNFDVGGRHGLSRSVRLYEAARVLGGDVFCLRMRDGSTQAILGDRIRNEMKSWEEDRETGAQWVHGVSVGNGGRAVSYRVWDRMYDGSYVNPRDIAVSKIQHLAYYDNHEQIRGVSPLSSAIAPFHDILEVKEYARLKAKVTQLFALAIHRDVPDYYTEDDSDCAQYSVDFGKGPLKLELEPGDKADFLESRHPSTEFQSFIQMSMQVALKALDIPWSFYDESFTNFFGSRSALVQYQKACKSKRDDLIVFLDELTRWRVALWVLSGVLELPTGMDVSQISWEWIPAGVPWWDPAKEVRGDIEAINANLRTRTEIRRERYGDDWKTVVRKLAEEREYLEELGLGSDVSVPAEDQESEDTDGQADDDQSQEMEDTNDED